MNLNLNIQASSHLSGSNMSICACPSIRKSLKQNYQKVNYACHSTTISTGKSEYLCENLFLIQAGK